MAKQMGAAMANQNHYRRLESDGLSASQQASNYYNAGYTIRVTLTQRSGRNNVINEIRKTFKPKKNSTLRRAILNDITIPSQMKGTHTKKVYEVKLK